MTNTPLTPPDADLQDFAFMPLHVARLRDSDLAAEAHPEACWYAVLLWAASWHQLPAGSLPNNDAVLARLCGLGRDLRTFRRHRDDALRGWALCDDGRLYHEVVAEQVLSAWRGKIEQRHRAECARIKKANQRNGTDLAAPALPEFVSANFPDSVPFLSLGTGRHVHRDEGSKRKGQREGEGQGDNNTDAEASGGEPPAPDPDKIMFDSGRALLAQSGIAADAAGRLLGRWRREHGSAAVIAALSAAKREGAIEPKSFIEGALRNGHRPRNSRNRAPGLLGAVLDAEHDGHP